MQRTATIRFLTPSTNKKGDIFTRLVKDFFRSLGYDDFRLDVQKSGREIDIEGRHRHAPRLLRAECKAHEDKMGGRELNALYGAVTRERDKTQMVIDAYFISLSGFTETGRVQEEESGDKQLILLEGPKVVMALEEHNLLPDDAVATEKAGQCAGRAGLMVGTLDGIELLAYEKGYAKAVYYAQNGQRTHFALIHADGTPLAAAPAQEIIDADQSVEGNLYTLQYLPPAPPVADLQAAQEAALEHYQRWLSTECAYIQLDGLPADSDVSASKLKLERLFVPVKAIPVKKEDAYDAGARPNYRFSEYHISDDLSKYTEEFSLNISGHKLYAYEPIAINELLSPKARLAFLSPPGGGKSTLLKRLATEYGFTDQLVKFADDMPAHDWLPLVMRCRDLQDQVKEPFMDILEKLPKRLNMLPEPAAAFKSYLHEALQLGRVLLLIDGLDEITEEISRKVFTKNLVSFLALFPQVTLVLTSREAGFRLVADVVASECASYKLAPFSEADVQRLCVQWHAEVVDYSEATRQKALKLAKNIWDNEHIRGLAKNPLLLTTLLVVNRRQGGELPKNRIMLYSKAVEVLIQTWNAEAHAPLDVEETLTQLSYLACYMMEQGIQQIGKRELVKTLREAQQTIPELRYTTISPANFIKQVEYRSSLLMQVGSRVIEDEEQDVFEFRHLTFQEYLAARGFVEGYHPRDKERLSLAQLLTPHFGQTAWREIIPLAAALAKRRAEELMTALVQECSFIQWKKLKNHPDRVPPIDVLRRCIVDEVVISSNETLRNALLQLGRLGPMAFPEEVTSSIMSGKHADSFYQLVEQAHMGSQPDWREYSMAFRELSVWHIKETSGESNAQYVEQVIALLRQPELLMQLRGLSALVDIGETRGRTKRRFRYWQELDISQPPFEMEEQQAGELYDLMDGLLHKAMGDHSQRLLLAVCEAFAEIPNISSANMLPQASSVAALFKLLGAIPTNPFDNEESRELHNEASQALRSLPLLSREALLTGDTGDFIVNGARGELDLGVENRPVSSLLIMAAWYRMFTLDDIKLLRWIDFFYNQNMFARSGRLQEFKEVKHYLSQMGKAGEQLLAERAERIAQIVEAEKSATL